MYIGLYLNVSHLHLFAHETAEDVGEMSRISGVFIVYTKL